MSSVSKRLQVPRRSKLFEVLCSFSSPISPATTERGTCPKDVLDWCSLVKVQGEVRLAIPKMDTMA